jgi:hypothetical protein
MGKEAERIGISRPVFTLGTANSACSGGYARILGIRENPLKYTDTDGKATVRNKSGDDGYVKYEKPKENNAGEILPSQDKEITLKVNFQVRLMG